MRVCGTCKKEKELKEFVKRKGVPSGYSYLCKKCLSKKAKDYYKKNKEKINEKNRENHKKNREKYNEKSREHYSKNKELKNYKARLKYKLDPEIREKARKRAEKWKKENADKCKDIIRQHSRKWRRENPDKLRAVNKLNRAVAKGVVVRPKKCSICHKEGRIEAHHYDYEKPLNVIWLCKRCHMIAHNKIVL